MSIPHGRTDRDNWILTHRPQRNQLDPHRPYAFLVEQEHSATKEIVPVAIIFLTNRECPWRCLMCDLWKNTLTETVPIGAIPAQIAYALDQLPPARQIKLYNSGSFFDPKAIPLEDHPTIVAQVANFERVIVECHPSLVGQNCFQFKSKLEQFQSDRTHDQNDNQNKNCHPERSHSQSYREGRSRRTCGSLPEHTSSEGSQPAKLEVAMGLETVHPKILAKLNKRMTTDDFTKAADLLRKNDIDLRVFILVKPPFMREEESLEWAARSLDFAFDCGATAATLIPTRAGNGAMEALEATGDFSPPRLTTLEAAATYGLTLNRGRVFADLWDLNPTTACPHCYGARIERLRTMNLHQIIPAPVTCTHCEASR
jgi:archaeosine synthase beta-subunit